MGDSLDPTPHRFPQHGHVAAYVHHSVGSVFAEQRPGSFAQGIKRNPPSGFPAGPFFQFTNTWSLEDAPSKCPYPPPKKIKKKKKKMLTLAQLLRVSEVCSYLFGIFFKPSNMFGGHTPRCKLQLDVHQEFHWNFYQVPLNA